MPSGKTHNTIWKNLWMLPVLNSILIYIVYEFTASRIFPYGCYENHCFAVSIVLAGSELFGYLLGKFITPDLDLPGVTHNEWQAMKMFGILGAFFTAFWFPYGYMFKHRGFWSHSYLFSTMVRMAYIYVATAIIMKDYYFNSLFWTVFVGISFGLALSDGIHIWSDNNYKEKKDE